jgi:(E)-4-hydroxy-3-methylbut-2-enyl-diphosphate synthase
MSVVRLHKTVGVKVGRVQVGGGAPIVVQAMTMTDTADARATATQCIELAEAGSEMVRITVNTLEAAAAVAEIKQRMLDAGCTAPLIGDFHYNGHQLLTRFPDCASALDKYRINPGNVGTGKRRDEQFSTICRVAVDHDRPVRIGVNGGSLNQELVLAKMQENTDRALDKTSEEIINECMVLSAVESTALALESGLRKDQIIISCKTSRPRDLIAVYRALSRSTDQPLHLGLTEAGMGTKCRSPHGRAAIAAKRSMPHASCCRRWACEHFRRASPPVPGAAAPPAARSRSWPSAFRTTSATRCRSGSCATTASKR